MSMMPYFVRSIWDDQPWASFQHPYRIFDQYFNNLLTEDINYPFRPRVWPDLCPPSLVTQRPPQTTGISEVINNEKEFRVGLDVKHFRPEELKVTTKDNRIIVHARHEERPDEHGYIMRDFSRQYVLPKDIDPASVTSTLTRDGILLIKAPKPVALEAPKERIVPISITQESEGGGDQ